MLVAYLVLDFCAVYMMRDPYFVSGPSSRRGSPRCRSPTAKWEPALRHSMAAQHAVDFDREYEPRGALAVRARARLVAAMAWLWALRGSAWWRWELG